MNNITKNGENLFINIGEILENKIKIKDDIFNNCTEFYNDYITLSLDYIKKLKSLFEKYNNINKLHQYKNIIFILSI